MEVVVAGGSSSLTSRAAVLHRRAAQPRQTCLGSSHSALFAPHGHQSLRLSSSSAPASSSIKSQRHATAAQMSSSRQGSLSLSSLGALDRGLALPQQQRLEVPTEGVNSVVQPQAARTKVPPVAPFVVTSMGPTDLMSAFLRNRIIFVGSTINAQTAQRVISQLIALSAVNEEEDIKMYINCPGGSTYSVLAIYDCMAWIKPDISTVGFGMCASQGAFLLSAGTKGKRMAMPNTRIMIHQPQGGCGGTAEDVRRQVNEVMASRDKLDKMFSAFTGQSVETIQKYTERDRFFSPAEAAEFGLIDGVLETEY